MDSLVATPQRPRRSCPRARNARLGSVAQGRAVGARLDGSGASAGSCLPARAPRIQASASVSVPRALLPIGYQREPRFSSGPGLSQQVSQACWKFDALTGRRAGAGTGAPVSWALAPRRSAGVGGWNPRGTVKRIEQGGRVGWGARNRSQAEAQRRQLELSPRLSLFPHASVFLALFM